MKYGGNNRENMNQIHIRNGLSVAKRSNTKLKRKDKVTFILVKEFTKEVYALVESLNLTKKNMITSERMRKIVRDQIKKRNPFEKKDISNLIIDSPYTKNNIDRYFEDGIVFFVKK